MGSLVAKMKLAAIKSAIGGHRIVDILLAVAKQYASDNKDSLGVDAGLPEGLTEFPPFLAAGVACFAMLYGRSGFTEPDSEFTASNFRQITNEVWQLFAHDPIVSDTEAKAKFVKQHPYLLITRTFADQALFQETPAAKIARIKLLWEDAVEEALADPDAHDFPLQEAFEDVFGLSLDEYRKLAWVILAASGPGLGTFTRNYFRDARSEHDIDLPDDLTVKRVVEKFVADPIKFKDAYYSKEADELRANSDSAFVEAYPYNPLSKYPILRPEKSYGAFSGSDDKMIAPLPNVLAARLSDAIHTEIAETNRRPFCDFFGDVFERYIGILLRTCFPDDQILSEKELEEAGLEGSLIDWVVRDGDTVVLIECKARRFPRHALLRSEPDWLRNNLRLIHKGIQQLRSVTDAVRNGEVAHDLLREPEHVEPILITYQRHYLLSSKAGKEFFCELFGLEERDDVPWNVWATDDLELLQPHLQAGFSVRRVAELFRRGSRTSALQEAQRETGLNFEDSYLAQVRKQILEDSMVS